MEESSSTTNDVESREKLIKGHYTKRINELTLKLQTAESKAVAFHSEVRVVIKTICKVCSSSYRVFFTTPEFFNSSGL